MDTELWVDSADREVALRALAEHHDEAHLTDAEHARRVALARAAKNRADLHGLFADLPPPHPQLDDVPIAAPSRGTGPALGVVLGSGGVIVVGALVAQWWLPALLLAVLVGVTAVLAARS